MNIVDVDILRVITHEVVRASQMRNGSPVLSEHIEALDDDGKALIAKRLGDTFASGSHCVDVTVEDSSDGSTIKLATSMLDGSDADFVEKSKRLANTLSSVQTAGQIKSGSAIFVQGTCLLNGSRVRFIALIKADSDQGLSKNVQRDGISLSYVKDLILGQSQRLIKVAFIVEDSQASAGARQGWDPDDFSIKVFDHLLQLSGNGDAATYFYQGFLRCKLSENAARQTKMLYELAQNVVSELPIPPVDRVALHGDIISYFRHNRATLEPITFAQEVFPRAHQDTFVRKCREAGIAEAISKDLTLLKGKMKRQTVRFSNDVTIYAPSEVFRDSVQIEAPSTDGWTTVRIRGTIETIP